MILSLAYGLRAIIVRVLDLHDVIAVIIALVAAAVFAAMIWAGNRVH